MKTKTSFTNQTRALHGALSFALLTGLALSPGVFAKKGGGKPGGGGEDPPPLPAPGKYELSWVEVQESTVIKSINSSGVAVGSTSVPGDGIDDRVPFLRFADGEWLYLNALLSDHPEFPAEAGWHLRLAGGITEDFIISGDVWGPDGGIHTFATKLVDNGPGIDPTVLWFRILTASDLGAPAHTAPHHAFPYDTSQTGELVVKVRGEYWDDGVSRTFTWTPETGDIKGPFNEEFVTGAYYGARINVHSEVLLPTEARIIDADTGIARAVPAGASLPPNDIGDDGVLVGEVQGERVRVKGYGWATTYAAARYLNGSWQPISPFWPRTTTRWRTDSHRINAAGQIVGYSDSRAFLYADDGITGLRLLDDLLDPDGDPEALGFWASLPDGLTFPDGSVTGLSEPDASGFGWICGGYYLDGRNLAFVLRPIAQP